VITWKNACEDDLNRLEAIKILFKPNNYLLNDIFDKKEPRLKKYASDIYNAYSSGEYLLIKIAFDIWNGSGKATIAELLDMPSVYSRFLTSIIYIMQKKGIVL